MPSEDQRIGRYYPGSGGSGGTGFYPVLAISEIEARVGTSRLLTLPDGRQIPISIPPGVQNGQMIDLNDPGAATGMLRLTLSVLPAQQAGVPAPLSWPGQVPMGSTSTFVNNPAHPNSGAGWANPNSPMFARSEPGITPDASTFAGMSGGIPSGAGWANPEGPAAPAQWQGGGTPYFAPALQTPPVQAPKREKRSSLTVILVSVIVVLVLILGSAGLLYAFHSNNSGGVAGNPGGTTATVNQGNSAATGTSQANGTATTQVQANGTATAQAVATATAQAQGTASAVPNATATATALLNPYGGTLVMNDPLADNSQGHQWREYTDSTTGTSCQFTNNAYHMVMPGNYGGPCMGASTSFDDFAFQVQMTFFKYGQHFSGGGLVFRADSTGTKYYVLEIFESGQYSFYSCTGNDCSKAIAGYPGPASISSFHLGLHQTNTIAVVAKGHTFTFYANGKRFAGPFSDSTYTQGAIGFFAEGGSEGGPGATADVAYSNAKVWQL